MDEKFTWYGSISAVSVLPFACSSHPFCPPRSTIIGHVIGVLSNCNSRAPNDYNPTPGPLHRDIDFIDSIDEVCIIENGEYR